MKLLANDVHIQGMEVLLADKVHKQEPQHTCQWLSLFYFFDFCKKPFNKSLFFLACFNKNCNAVAALALAVVVSS